MNMQRKIQEKQYNFCYHYLPSFKKGFRLAPIWEWGLQYVASIKFLIEELEKIKFNSLIDIGCGDGRIVRELHDFFPEKSISGIDISKKAIKLACALNPELSFEENNIIRSDVVDRYNVVLLIEVIEHIPPNQLNLFLEKTSNYLLEDGYLILTTPSMNKKLSNKHFQHFSMRQLNELLNPYFEIVRSSYLHNPNKIFKWMMKILYNKWFILNYQRLLNYIFNYYYRNILKDRTGRGHRIYILARKKRKGFTGK